MDLPLFPDMQGQAVEKDAMVGSILAAARALGVEPLRDGSERPSGHSLRATGAQGLLRRGWSPRAVQLMGRWASEVVNRYTRLAPLEAALSPGLPGVTAPQRADLLHELQAAGHLEQEAVDILEPVPTPGRTLHWVLNLSSGVHHVRRPGEQRARCGWRYSRSPHAEAPEDAPPPAFPWAVCALCAPEVHTRLQSLA